MSPRPARITRAQIVHEAVSLLDKVGVEAFSMRRLASRLGVDPMSIYHHVPSKAALFDEVVGWIWAQVPPVDDAGLDWREVVAGLARDLRAALLDHPHLVPLVGTRPAVAPDMIVRIEDTLGQLAARGLAPVQALPLLDCIVGYVVGKVLAELRLPAGGDSQAPEDAVAALAPEAFPNLFAAMAAGHSWAPDAEFDHGLEAMLRGWVVDDEATDRYK